jgi:hypothetical protein
MAAETTTSMHLTTDIDALAALPPRLLGELCLALRSIRFGTVELVIHEGRVVQLERREKVRFEEEVRQHRR